jgi:prostaglandin-endoperoxide synthase 2
MAGKRDRSKDGFDNILQTFLLTNFKGIWQLLQSNESIKRKVNKTLINSLIYKIPTRPNAYSMMSLDKHIPDTEIPKKLILILPGNHSTIALIPDDIYHPIQS